MPSTTIGTLKIKLELDGVAGAKRELKEFKDSTSGLGSGIGGILAQLNKFRWAFMAIQTVIGAVTTIIEAGIKTWSAGFKIMGKVIDVSLISPLKLLGVAAGSAFASVAGLGTLVGVAAAKQFTKLDDVLVDVRRTTGLSTERIQELRKQLKDMSLQTRTSVNDLAQIAVVAGQVGIRGTDNISQFTREIDRLSVALDINASETATVFARAMDVFNLEGEIDNVRKMGNVVNELSNTTSASGDEIIQAISNAGSTLAALGVSFEDAASLVTASITTGFLPAATAGTSIRRAFEGIIKSADDVGSIMGMTGDEVRNSIGTDAVGFMKDFLQSVQGNENAAERLGIIVDALGVRGAKSANALLNNWGQVEAIMESANSQFETGNSTLREFERSVNSVGGVIDVMRNSLNNFLDDVGGALVPELLKAVGPFKELLRDSAGPLADVFKELATIVSSSLSSAFVLLRENIKPIAGFFETVVGVIGGASRVFGTFFNSLISVLSPAEFLATAGDRIRRFWENNLATFQILATLLGQKVAGAIDLVVQGFSSLLEGLDIPGLLTNLVTGFSDLVTGLQGAANGDFNEFYGTLGETISSVVTNVSSLISALVRVDSEGRTPIGNMISKFTDFFDTLQTKMDALDVQSVIEFLETIADAFARVADTLGDLLDAETIADLQTLIGAGATAASATAGLTKAALDQVGPALDVVEGVRTGDAAKIAGGVVGIVEKGSLATRAVFSVGRALISRIDSNEDTMTGT